MQLGVPGTTRVTTQSHLTPSATAIRVFAVTFLSTTTNTALHLCDNDGTESSSTSTALPTLSVHDNYSKMGNWSSNEGVRFDDGVLVFTSTNFSYAAITFSTEA